MAAKKGGLGRGFNALFEDNAASSLSDEKNIVSLPLGDVEPNPDQPRKVFEDEPLRELAESIKEHGVLQPLIVRPETDGSYRIVAGERRWRAAALAGLSEVPVIIRDLDDKSVALIALIENIQREDLNAVEQAKGIQKLIDDFGLTQEQAADRLGFARPTVTNLLRLNALPGGVLDMITEDKISAGHARALLGLDDKSLIETAAKEVVDSKLSVRQTEKLVKTYNEPPKPSKEKKPDAFLTQVQAQLNDALGRRVRIRPGKNGGGSLEIEFFDSEDLMRLSKQLEE